MDIDKEIFWFEIDHIFQSRLADRKILEREETMSRNEELLWLRDHIKHMWDTKGECIQ